MAERTPPSLSGMLGGMGIAHVPSIAQRIGWAFYPPLLAAWRPEGEWIARLDLVEQGDRLVVQEMEQVGAGNGKCTVAHVGQGGPGVTRQPSCSRLRPPYLHYKPPCHPCAGRRVRRGVQDCGAGGGAHHGGARHRYRGSAVHGAQRPAALCLKPGAWVLKAGSSRVWACRPSAWPPGYCLGGASRIHSVKAGLRPSAKPCCASGATLAGQEEPCPVHQLAVLRAERRMQAQAAAAAQGRVAGSMPTRSRCIPPGFKGQLRPRAAVWCMPDTCILSHAAHSAWSHLPVCGMALPHHCHSLASTAAGPGAGPRLPAPAGGRAEPGTHGWGDAGKPTSAPAPAAFRAGCLPFI